MIKLPVHNKEGKKQGDREVPEAVFGVDLNQDLIHQVYVAKLANARKNYAHAKTRAEVRGGGRKPWRQKGTGRARHGSRRSPIWVGGGVTFGPSKDRVFSKKVNKKMNKKAIASVLSSKLSEGDVLLVDSLGFEEAKTKNGAGVLEAVGASNNRTVVYGTSSDDNFIRVFKNIPKVEAVNINQLNIVDILHNKKCLFSNSALDYLINIYGESTESIQKEKGGKGGKTAKERQPTKAK